jgi:hypothetical protein
MTAHHVRCAPGRRDRTLQQGVGTQSGAIRFSEARALQERDRLFVYVL